MNDQTPVMNPATTTHIPQDDHGAFRPDFSVRTSRIFAALLLAIFAAACAGAAVSYLPLWIRLVALTLLALLLWQTWQQEQRHGLRYLAADPQNLRQLTLHFADGRKTQSTYAGYALLGTVAIFVFSERQGWQKILGPQRHAILRDATDASSFRRLRTWVRLA